MNLWMTTVFTNADICTVGTCFTVDDTMSYLGLLWRRMIRIKISWIKRRKISCTVGLSILITTLLIKRTMNPNQSFIAYMQIDFG